MYENCENSRTIGDALGPPPFLLGVSQEEVRHMIRRDGGRLCVRFALCRIQARIRHYCRAALPRRRGR
jgi:hypothetical protein